MSKSDDIAAARKILGLPEKATMDMIKSSYRKMLNQWHPDKCKDDPKNCTEMTHKIISAYATIMDYCAHYQYSFAKDAVKDHQPSDGWWYERFGDTPWWGKNNQK